MCTSKVQHVMGRKTSCNRSKPVFFGFYIFTKTWQLATGLTTNVGNCNWKKTGPWFSPVQSYVYFQSCRLDLRTLGGVQKNKAKDRPVPKGTNRRSSKAKEVQASIFSNAVSLGGRPDVVYWGNVAVMEGENDTGLTPDIISQVIWNTFELNFRHEIHQLDCHLLPAAWASVSEAGLRDTSKQLKARYMSESISEAKFRESEQAVVVVYCQTFFDNFGRAPCTLHEISQDKTDNTWFFPFFPPYLCLSSHGTMFKRKAVKSREELPRKLVAAGTFQTHRVYGTGDVTSEPQANVYTPQGHFVQHTDSVHDVQTDTFKALATDIIGEADDTRCTGMNVKVRNTQTRIKCVGENPIHLTLTHTHTHTITISVQEFEGLWY
ncbi:uncharacterized protein LACBIDRAFT_332757 [Laccaria bicolor S238N-H82]|uniref:Predicted protein n=1 Tax=Laccaria bicolor (strain S238N-H82 / ATCC MYA-4686) TaxID=486041 RepID=B0DTZ7_LACBS|nr:uncharacterized protein LACBIDRAFT_332757 [Laccaria bicolor S238N-H82]EDR01937.1 predicted protein [Laccaria bicolor S238N-H82]|eukprot:XP_001887328.1 predicted protein [Laccaria bicolor S238N-H82]